jgi:sugar phosphate isomerase/epimerase
MFSNRQLVLLANPMKQILFLFVPLSVAILFLSSGCAQPGRSNSETGSFKGPVGLQLYSLREQFKKDVPGTLDEVKSYGIKYVELAGTYGMPPADFKAELTKRGLVPIGAHFGFEKYRDDLGSVVREAEALGLKYSGCAWIPHSGNFDEKTCHQAAEVFNKAGAALAKKGIKFFYHTHGYEFQPYKDGTLFDELLAKTDPKLVSYEMDIFWIVHPGQDPAQLLAKYPNRFALMHLKDMKKETPTGLLTGSSDVRNDAALGTGKIDMPGVLKAAKKIGVKYYFIEDESPWSEQQIPVSLEYLKQVRW